MEKIKSAVCDALITRNPTDIGIAKKLLQEAAQGDHDMDYFLKLQSLKNALEGLDVKKESIKKSIMNCNLNKVRDTTVHISNKLTQGFKTRVGGIATAVAGWSNT